MTIQKEDNGNVKVYNRHKKLLFKVGYTKWTKTVFRPGPCNCCQLASYVCEKLIFGSKKLTFGHSICSRVKDGYYPDLSKSESTKFYNSIRGKIIKKNLRKDENKNTRRYSLDS